MRSPAWALTRARREVYDCDGDCTLAISIHHQVSSRRIQTPLRLDRTHSRSRQLGLPEQRPSGGTLTFLSGQFKPEGEIRSSLESQRKQSIVYIPSAYGKSESERCPKSGSDLKGPILRCTAKATAQSGYPRLAVRMTITLAIEYTRENRSAVAVTADPIAQIWPSRDPPMRLVSYQGG